MATPRIDELKKRYDENPRRFFAPLANEYRKAGDLEQAISICQTHLGEQPGNMNGHVVYGQALYDASRFDEARTTFETALSLDPENLIALRHLGDIARLHGAVEEARGWYQRVLDADPRNDEILAFIQELDATPPAAPAAVEAPVVESPAATAPTVELTPPTFASEAKTVEFAPPPRPTTPTPAPADHGLLDVSIDLGAQAEGSFDLRIEQTAAGAEAPALEWLPAEEAPADAAGFGEISIDAPEVPALPPVEAESGPPAAAVPDPAMPAADAWDIGMVDLDAPAAPPEPEPEPIAAAQAPDPVGDALFGDEPIAGLADEPLVPEGLAAHAAEQQGAQTVNETPQAFVTETMAELYLQQGFRDEALQVYRQLAAMNPADEGLQERVRSLEGGGRSSMSFERVSAEVPEVAAGTAPIGDVFGDAPTPVAPIDSIAPSLPEPSMAGIVPGAATPAASPHESARAFFAALAQRRAVRRDGTPAGGIPPVATPQDDVLPDGRAGTLDALFGGTGSAPGDDDIARALAQAASGVEPPTPGKRGRPTKQADTELSLDSVFRSEGPLRTSGPVRGSQKIKFDQFFAPAEPGGEAPAPEAPGAIPSSPADDAQFQSWLSGLKKP